LILRKFIKIVAKRRQILRPKCRKSDVGWGSDPNPAGGAYSIYIAGSKGPYYKGRREGREGKNPPKKKPGYGPETATSQSMRPATPDSPRRMAVKRRVCTIYILLCKLRFKKT